MLFNLERYLQSQCFLILISPFKDNITAIYHSEVCVLLHPIDQVFHGIYILASSMSALLLGQNVQAFSKLELRLDAECLTSACCDTCLTGWEAHHTLSLEVFSGL